MFIVPHIKDNQKKTYQNYLCPAAYLESFKSIEILRYEVLKVSSQILVVIQRNINSQFEVNAYHKELRCYKNIGEECNQ
jgi:hypothetical protein